MNGGRPLRLDRPRAGNGAIPHRLLGRPGPAGGRSGRSSRRLGLSAREWLAVGGLAAVLSAGAVALLTSSSKAPLVATPAVAPAGATMAAAPSSPAVAAAPAVRMVQTASPPATPAVADPKVGQRVSSAPDPTRDLTPYRTAPPYLVESGLLFRSERGTRTRLAGLVGPAREAVCLDEQGLLWACGLQARAALLQVIGQGELACTPVQPSDGIVIATCAADGQDIGRQLVQRGFARPAAETRDAAMDEARTARRGLWNGGWRIRQ